MSAWDWDRLSKQQRHRPPGPSGGDRGGSGMPPQFTDLVNRFREFRGKGLLIAGLVALVVVIWLLTGFYSIRPEQRGVVKIFGRVVGEPTLPGLHYAPPYPIAEVLKPKVTSVRQITVGGQGAGGPVEGGGLSQSLMLTRDARIINIQFTVKYKINPDKIIDYLFNVKGQDQTVMAAAEASMRDVVARTDFDDVLAKDRSGVQQLAAVLLQRVLDTYRLGVTIVGVELQTVSPPPPVVAAFDDVKKAIQDKVRYIRQAEEFRRKLLEEAYGEAKKMKDEAKAYYERKLRQAEGDTARFKALVKFLTLYGEGPRGKMARRITMERLYLEALEAVLFGSRKFVLSGRIGSRLLSHFGLGRTDPAPSSRSSR
jgi:membrane protease subunit HflK